jgi:hypothetical protein
MRQERVFLRVDAQNIFQVATIGNGKVATAFELGAIPRDETGAGEVLYAELTRSGAKKRGRRGSQLISGNKLRTLCPFPSVPAIKEC